MAIRSFACRYTKALFDGQKIAKYTNIEKQAMRKLIQLHVAMNIEDMRVPPGNCLEPLMGNRKGSYSVRINQQWRLCFKFENGEANEVEIVDYH
jgi:proteic killer suppression protein